MIDILRACLVLVLATDIPASDKGDGKPWGDRYISNHYKKIIEKAGITKDIGLRTLRHTYATLSLQHDELQNVSRTLGHSSIRTTHDIYGHVIAGSGRKASERFAEALKEVRYAHLRKMANRN